MAKKKTGIIDFSYSRYSLYSECPQKYKFRYVDKLPEKPKPYFAFGSAIHNALEFLFDIKTPHFPPLEQVLERFEKEWFKTEYFEKGYPSFEGEKQDYVKGMGILKGFYEKHKDDGIVPLAVEFKTKFVIDGLNFTSIVDRIDYLGDGKLSVMDYKTGETIVKSPDQLHIYQKILESVPDLAALVFEKTSYIGDCKVEKLGFYQLNSLKFNAFETGTKEEIDALWAKVLKTADNVKAQNFEPTPSEKTCRWCDFKNLCPVYATSTKEDAKVQAQLSQQPVLSSIAPQNTAEEVLTLKVERFGELLRKEKEIKDEIEELKKEIIALMAASGMVKHFAAKYMAAIETKFSWHFKDKEKLIETIKKLDLLARVSKPTLGEVCKLLDDQTLPETTRKKLLEHASKVETPDLACIKLED